MQDIAMQMRQKLSEELKKKYDEQCQKQDIDLEAIEQYIEEDMQEHVGDNPALYSEVMRDGDLE